MQFDFASSSPREHEQEQPKKQKYFGEGVGDGLDAAEGERRPNKQEDQNELDNLVHIRRSQRAVRDFREECFIRSENRLGRCPKLWRR